MEFPSFFFTISLFLIISFPNLISSNSPHSHNINPNQSPFGFLKHLQGCHKGDKLQGLHDLKNYLKKFGYFGHNIHTQSHDIDDDVFDDQLEFAIRTYQVNYNLNATGVLDASTVAQMSMPRCGVPDIINGTTWMKSNKNHHHHGHFHTVSHYSFFQGSPKWPQSKSHLTYAFSRSVPTVAMAPVSRAFKNWASSTHFTFSQTSDYQGADIKISFERGNHGDISPFDGRGGTIAHAFAPTDGRFHYDADEPYAVGAVPRAFDWETVALHEIGHLLGLGHSRVQGAIMWPQISMGRTKGLHPDDIAGIRALYNNA